MTVIVSLSDSRQEIAYHIDMLLITAQTVQFILHIIKQLLKFF